MVIISSSNETVITKFLDDVGLNCYFEKVYGKRASTSKVEKFNMLFEDFNVKPDECLFITDTLGDLNEAEEVKVESIAVTWGYHDRKTLESGKSIAIVDSVEELQHHIP